LNRALFADLFQGQLYLPQSYGGKTAATVSFSKYERGEREQPKEGDWICPHVCAPNPSSRSLCLAELFPRRRGVLQCRTNNFARRDVCFKCSQQRYATPTPPRPTRS